MNRIIKRIISGVLFSLILFEQTAFSQIAVLPESVYFSPSANFPINDNFRPFHLRAINYLAESESFKVVFDKGDSGKIHHEKLRHAAQQLMNYFLIGLSLPNKCFWVNLRPDAPRNIIDPYLEKTDIGRILLDADVNLKKDLARLLSVDSLSGRNYWDKLYMKAKELFGSERVDVPAYTRPWIVPGEVILRQDEQGAFIYKATLKVMLEEDYPGAKEKKRFKDARFKALNEYSSDLIRKTIIPRLTRYVNNSRHYAQLRQVYYSLILAQWFKSEFSKTHSQNKSAYISRIDSKNLIGLVSQEAWQKEKYFEEYRRSFERGEYKKSEVFTNVDGVVSIRQYVSGGINLNALQTALVKGEGFFNILASNLKLLSGSNTPYLTVAEFDPGSGKMRILQSLSDGGKQDNDSGNTGKMLRQLDEIYGFYSDKQNNYNFLKRGEGYLHTKDTDKDGNIILFSGEHGSDTTLNLAYRFMRDMIQKGGFNPEEWLFLVEGSGQGLSRFVELDFFNSVADYFNIQIENPMKQMYSMQFYEDVSRAAGVSLDDVLFSIIAEEPEEESISFFAHLKGVSYEEMGRKWNKWDEVRSAEEKQVIYDKMRMEFLNISNGTLSGFLSEKKGKKRNILIVIGGLHVPAVHEVLGKDGWHEKGLNTVNIHRALSLKPGYMGYCFYHEDIYPDFMAELSFRTVMNDVLLEVLSVKQVNEDEVWVQVKILSPGSKEFYKGLPAADKDETGWIKVFSYGRRSFGFRLKEGHIDKSNDGGGKQEKKADTVESDEIKTTLEAIHSLIEDKKNEFREAATEEESLDIQRFYNRIDVLEEIFKNLADKHSGIISEYMNNFINPLFSYSGRVINFTLSSAEMRTAVDLFLMDSKRGLSDKVISWDIETIREKGLDLAGRIAADLKGENNQDIAMFSYLPGTAIIVDSRGASKETYSKLKSLSDLIIGSGWLEKSGYFLRNTEVVSFKKNIFSHIFADENIDGHAFIDIDDLNNDHIAYSAALLIYNDERNYCLQQDHYKRIMSLEDANVGNHPWFLGSSRPADLLIKLIAMARAIEFELHVKNTSKPAFIHEGVIEEYERAFEILERYKDILEQNGGISLEALQHKWVNLYQEIRTHLFALSRKAFPEITPRGSESDPDDSEYSAMPWGLEDLTSYESLQVLKEKDVTIRVYWRDILGQGTKVSIGKIIGFYNVESGYPIVRLEGAFGGIYVHRIEKVEIVSEADGGESEQNLLATENAAPENERMAVKKESSLFKVKQQNTGGIDFRYIPVFNLPGPAVNTGTNEKSVIPLLDPDKEWNEIQQMVKKGIIPSVDKIKMYVLSCCRTGYVQPYIERMLICIMEILRLQEEYVIPAEPGFVQVLAVLESGKSAKEIKVLLNGIQF